MMLSIKQFLTVQWVPSSLFPIAALHRFASNLYNQKNPKTKHYWKPIKHTPPKHKPQNKKKKKQTENHKNKTKKNLIKIF